MTPLGGSDAGEIFLRQGLDDLPLLPVGILRFIDKNVVGAAIAFRFGKIFRNTFF
jgi:hypothetical protein